MSFQALSCESCGGNQITRRGGRFVCGFCGATVVPRFVPGTLCGDGGSSFCSQPAESVCRGCARPLCTRHNDPKQVEWLEFLHWPRLFPHWQERDASDWARVNGPFQQFPVAGYEPFRWAHHLREARYREGLLEDEMLDAIRPLLSIVGGDAQQESCHLESVCTPCEADLTRQIDKTLSNFADRYRQTVYVEGLWALHAECEAQLCYIESFLGRPVELHRPSDIEKQPDYVELSVLSDRADWERCGWEVKTRLALLDRLRPRVSPD